MSPSNWLAGPRRWLKGALSPVISKVWDNPHARFTAQEAMRRMSGHGFPISVVVDIGASDGRWSRAAMGHFPGARVLAIEPLDERRAALEALKAGHPQFDFVIAAAGSGRTGKVSLAVAGDLDGSTVGGEGPGRDVPAVTLDALIAERGLEGPFLLKFDTHGFESEILEGATGTLKQTSVIIMEVYNFAVSPHAARFPQMCASLEARGFRCYDMADPLLRLRDGCLWQMDFYFCRGDASVFHHNGYR